MPLYNPGILATGGNVTGNLAVTGNGTVSGTETVSGILTAAAGLKSSLANVLTPTFASGTAAQLSDTTIDYMVYLQIGTAGTAFTVQIGPTSTPANTIISNAAAAAGEIFTVRLPAAWYLKYSITTGTIANQIAISA